jgi:hypothetical protein
MSREQATGDRQQATGNHRCAPATDAKVNVAGSLKKPAGLLWLRQRIYPAYALNARLPPGRSRSLDRVGSGVEY